MLPAPRAGRALPLGPGSWVQSQPAKNEQGYLSAHHQLAGQTPYSCFLTCKVEITASQGFRDDELN